MYLPPWPVPNTLRTVLLVATPGCVRGWGSWREAHRTTRLVRASAKHHSSYGSACLPALYLGQPSSAQEHRHRVTAGVGGDLLQDLDGVVCQKVVQLHPAVVPEHAVRVVPVAVELQHMAVTVQELPESVQLLVRPQWLHGCRELGRGRLYCSHSALWRGP